MLTEFLLISGWAFWGIILAAIVLDVVFLSSDDMEGWAVFITAGVVLSSVLFTDAFVGVRISTLVAALAVYLVLGVVWSIKKWYSFVVDLRAKLKKDYDGDAYINKAAKGNEAFESYIKNQRPTAAKKQKPHYWMDGALAVLGVVVGADMAAPRFRLAV